MSATAGQGADPGAQGRTVRVFVSSTFRDMHAERDELAKFVFPALRDLCESRNVTWVDVDLRWGITEQEAHDGLVLPRCLEEIEESRPYFLGLLGERYGWVPESIDSALVMRQPWLAEHREKSVTELEIIHGVLNNPEMAEHAFFYFRDPGHGGALPGQPDPDDIDEFGYQAATARRDKLASLKRRIRASGVPVRENYADPKSLGALIASDLRAVINRRFPAGSAPAPLDAERQLHHAFAGSRAGIYVARQAYLDRLDAHANGTGPPLVLVGTSGAGKSSLLANWALGRPERTANATQVPELPLVMHFVAASPDSADWAAMLRRILGEFNRLFDPGVEIPKASPLGAIDSEAEKLVSAFGHALSHVAQRGRMVLIIDALDQLDDRDGAPDLVWLPTDIPANIRLMLSTLPGRPLTELQRRNWQWLEVAALEPAERAQLTREYLWRYRKRLPAELSDQIVTAAQTANPLFLRALLEELRIHGDHDTLIRRITELLAAEDMPTLYGLIFSRWEQDYERERPGLVRDTLNLLWASRNGLSETELLDLLGDGERLPHARWSPLHLAAKTLLVNHDGYLNFAHRFVRIAVEDRYLPDDDARTQAHLRLAAYFERPVNEPDLILDMPRELRELPWQLMAARAWPKLYDLLATPAALEYLRLTPEDVLRYWAAVQRNSPLRLRDAYAPMQNAPKDYSTFVLQFVADLLRRTGHVQDSLGLLKKTAAAAEEQNITVLFADRRSVNVNMLLSQATALMQIDELDQAASLAAEAESLSREIDYRRGLARALELRAAIALKHNTFAPTHDDFDEPRAALEEAERIWRDLSDFNGLQVVLGNRALILERVGDLDGALALHQEEERLCRGLANQDQLRACLINQSNLHRQRKEFGTAWELAAQAEQIARDLGRNDALQRAVRLQGAILWDEIDGSQKGGVRGQVLADPEMVRKLLGDRDGAVALETHRDQLCGSFADRWQLLKQTERIARELALRDGIQRVVCLQTELLEKQIAALRVLGNRRGELTLLRALERIARELADHQGVIKTLSRQATNLLERGEVPEAMDAAQKALNYSQEHGLAESARHVEHLIESIGARESR